MVGFGFHRGGTRRVHRCKVILLDSKSLRGKNVRQLAIASAKATSAGTTLRIKNTVAATKTTACIARASRMCATASAVREKVAPQMTATAKAVSVLEPRGTEVTSAAVEARFSAIHGRLETANQVGRTVKDTWVIDVLITSE